MCGGGAGGAERRQGEGGKEGESGRDGERRTERDNALRAKGTQTVSSRSRVLAAGPRLASGLLQEGQPGLSEEARTALQKQNPLVLTVFFLN